MKKSFVFLTLSMLFLFCCSDDDGNQPLEIMTTFKFSHNWDGALVTNINFNAIQYTNANGDLLSIERLRYVVSDIVFSNNERTIELDMHHLIDVTNNDMVFTPQESIPSGTYNVSFTFGLDNEDNSQNLPDLNTANFNVPQNLGGGYHYMQLDGKFVNANMEEQGYNYHAIRAADNPGPNPTFPQDTFFEVDLGSIDITTNVEIEVEMNIAQWFKEPNLWDLNILNQMLMPNSQAQILMFQNGQNVFSLGDVSQ
ncbi:MbnP family protein [Winogradskyella alexanderae]|uniref:Copper-binding protein MbnP-like domain-containing protein n=1 Tax=Winogradskyella alexanderae TaxID=2877123 RepID=A0ABS7XME3_9FLAO|nr:MbnP family protein [Winogradskyella alexanderae]MCA0131158.1 hypothetical protein [Winogradskyella alexanderae]